MCEGEAVSVGVVSERERERRQEVMYKNHKNKALVEFGENTRHMVLLLMLYFEIGQNIMGFCVFQSDHEFLKV